jgi:hypothetical protein
MAVAAVEDEDPSNWWPRAAVIDPMAITSPATRILRTRTRFRCAAGFL